MRKILMNEILPNQYLLRIQLENIERENFDRSLAKHQIRQYFPAPIKIFRYVVANT